MATYAIGDIQGCYTDLKNLLREIGFNASSDYLWFVGDIVNRGPNSLEVLRYIAENPRAQMVLGNHDLHLLAVAEGIREARPGDSLKKILKAPDRDELRRHRQLLEPELRGGLGSSGGP